MTEQGDRENLEAVLQVSMAANTSVYDEIRREAGRMCEAFQELFKDEINRKVEDGRQEGIERGQAMQIIRMSIKYNVNDDKIITELVEELQISPKQAEQYLMQYGKR
jgi:predicted transposase YdaD